MRYRAPHALPILALLLLGPAFSAAAEEAAAALRFEPGDRYELVLQSDTTTEATSLVSSQPGFEEEVRLDYRATVLVLAADALGVPVRERHSDVSVSFKRPDRSGSLFTDAARFEVQRVDGEIKIRLDGRPAPEPLAEVLRRLLAERLDRAELAAWLRPKRAVSIGDSWELAPEPAQRLLAERGIRAVALETPPTATLESSAGSRFIRYRIPVLSLELLEAPRYAARAQGRALLEGRLELAGGADDVAGEASHDAATFTLDVQGAPQSSPPSLAWSSGASPERPELPSPRWRLQRTTAVSQQIVRLEQLASSR